MPGFFPTSFPDELLYSVIARYSDAVQYRSVLALTMDLFGRRINFAADFPGYLGALASRLPSEHGMSPEKLVWENTLLPYYAYTAKSAVVEKVLAILCEGRRSNIYRTLGLTATKIPKTQYLRYCPQCVMDDRREFGEPYWRRTHQLPGVFVCHIHGIPVVYSSVPIRSATLPTSLRTFLDQANTGRDGTCAPPDSFRPILLRLALDSAWILSERSKRNDLMVPADLYFNTLKAKGFTSGPRIRQQQLRAWLLSYYPREFLEMLNCPVSPDTRADWISGLIQPSQSCAKHPVHHLLLMQALGICPADYKLAKPSKEECYGRS